VNKKGYMYVSIIFVLVCTFGFYISSRSPRVEIITPEKDTILSEQDYQVDTVNGILTVGKSTWDEVASVYPEGKNLGMSTIFRPERHNCLLTFSEDENILVKMHIDGDEPASPRGVRVGEPYYLVKVPYGDDYTLIKNTGNDKDFDMVYGENRSNSITFKIKNQQVNRIIIQREVQ
jgi:hypothetical protein